MYPIVLQVCHPTVTLFRHCAGKNSLFSLFSLVAGCERCDNLGAVALIIKTVIWSGALLLYLWGAHAQWSDCVETRRVLDPRHKGLYFQGIFEYQCWDMITPAAPLDDTHPHTHHTFQLLERTDHRRPLETHINQLSKCARRSLHDSARKKGSAQREGGVSFALAQVETSKVS